MLVAGNVHLEVKKALLGSTLAYTSSANTCDYSGCVCSSCTLTEEMSRESATSSTVYAVV